MSYAPRKSMFGPAAWVGLVALVVLHALGLFGYVTRQVMVPAWLWENQDYQLFLSQYYHHAHILLMAGHLYLWGPYLITRQFHRPAWPLYWASFVVAFGISAFPTYKMLRFAELHGTWADAAVRAYAVILALYFVYQLIGRRTRPEVVAFHLFSGLPIILLFLRGKETFGVPNGYVVWALVVLHIVVALVVQARGFGPIPEPARRSRAALVASGLLLVAAGVALPAASAHRTPLRQEAARVAARRGRLRADAGRAKLEDTNPPPDHERFRTYDGSWNNLNTPKSAAPTRRSAGICPRAAKSRAMSWAHPETVAISDRLLKQSGVPLGRADQRTGDGVGELLRPRLLQPRRDRHAGRVAEVLQDPGRQREIHVHG